MRRTQSVLLVPIALLSNTAYAEDVQGPAKNPDMRDHALSAGLFLGGFFASERHEFYDPANSTQKELGSIAADIGLRVGYLPMPFVGAEAEANLVLAGVDGTDSVSLLGFRAHIIGQFPFEHVTPFAVAGLGVMGVTSNDDVLGADADLLSYLGAGTKYRIVDEWVARADVRLIGAPEANSFGGVTAHWELLFGLSYDIGGRSAPTEESVADEPAEPTTAIDDDGDGIAEGDQCPGKPETVNSYQDEDGCPDEAPDTDGDGLHDLVDSCIDTAEDKDDFEDDDGCPEEDDDKDKDSIVDSLDTCPLEAGPAENRGCPDMDRDRDGVVDRKDNCPDQRGKPEHQGCAAMQLVVITDAQLEILDQVFSRTGKSVLLARSFPVLNNVAAVLMNHPEITEIEVAGRTDEKGEAGANLALSQAQAEAVVQYLVDQGVSEDRLRAKGYGADQPSAEGTDHKARKANQRVEFNIVNVVFTR